MAELVFLRRSEQDIQIIGGTIYIDIDGRNVGILSRTNQVIDVPAGTHTIKMYKSFHYDSFVGFAEATINVSENEQLMVRYAASMAANQSGNIIIVPYNPIREAAILRERDSAIERDYAAAEKIKQEQNKKYNTGIIIFICFLAIDAVIWAIWMALL